MTKEVFITPHAVTQFQRRICTAERRAGVADDYGGRQPGHQRSRLPDGETLRVRNMPPFPYEFRAYCVYDHGRGIGVDDHRSL